MLAFVRDLDDEAADSYTNADWNSAVIRHDGTDRTFCIGGDEYEMSSFCRDCGRMIGIARKRMDERLGSGPIKVRRGKDGKYVDLESWQEYMFMVDESEPSVEFALEDEVDRNGEPMSFTDIDLAKLSFWRIRKVLVGKGFTDIPYWQIEDHAQSVSLTFLEKLKCAGCGMLCYFKEPCEVGAPAEDILNLHAYHWACCKGEAKKLMTEWVERRMAEIPEDVLDVSRAMNMTDEQTAAAWRHGAVELIDVHEKEAPLWKALEVDGLRVEFDNNGIHLSDQEVKTLRNSILAESGQSKDGRNKAKVKKILAKIGEDAPVAYGILMKRLESNKRGSSAAK